MAVGKANYFFSLNITVDIDCLELYKTFCDDGALLLLVLLSPL